MSIKKAADVVVEAKGDVKVVVDYAIETKRIFESANTELEAIKVHLREVGRGIAAKTGESSAELVGDLGTATVVFPKDAPRAKEKVDLSMLEAQLPAEVFYDLFKKKVTIEFNEDFDKKLVALPPAQRSVVSALVEIAPATPRVNLPK